jgi:hypothetical protein
LHVDFFFSKLYANVFDHEDIKSLPTNLHQYWLLQLCTKDNILEEKKKATIFLLPEIAKKTFFVEDRMKISADKASCLASIPSFGLWPQIIYNK